MSQTLEDVLRISGEWIRDWVSNYLGTAMPINISASTLTTPTAAEKPEKPPVFVQVFTYFWLEKLCLQMDSGVLESCVNMPPDHSPKELKRVQGEFKCTNSM